MCTDRPLAQDIIDMWKTKSSKNYVYFERAEAQTAAFWAMESPFRRKFDLLDRDVVVEIACGTGRHTAIAAQLCSMIWAVDTSVDALAELAGRFRHLPSVKPLLVSGDSYLPDIEDNSITAVFSYDAMVHFELLTIASYLTEISRILRRGCKALLHHSNHGSNPEGKFTDNPGWRNFMTADIMRHLASRNRLRVVSQTILDWNVPQLDALTLLQKC